jgi:thioredoxin-related protein
MKSFITILICVFMLSACATTHQPMVQQPEPEPEIEDVAWRIDLIGGSVEAEYYKWPMMVYVTDDGHCNPCRKMDKTFENQKLVKYLNEKFVATKIDIDSDDARKLYVKGYPAVYFIKMDGEKTQGKILGYRTGYMTAKELTKILDKVLELYEE